MAATSQVDAHLQQDGVDAVAVAEAAKAQQESMAQLGLGGGSPGGGRPGDKFDAGPWEVKRPR